MSELLKNKRILVVVAHPDDELLGLGASMHRLIHREGCVIRAVILGEGVTSRSEKRDRTKWEEALKLHRENIHSAQKAIGYASVGIYDFPDNRFDSVDLLDLVKVVEKEKKEFQPEIIFTHHGGDLNVDHQLTFQAVMTACRPMQEEQVHTLIAFETPSSTEWQAAVAPQPFLPNFFLQVEQEDVEAKIKGMEAYELERREFPHPRSPEALRGLARMRGVSIGTAFAEAFMLIRSKN